MRMARESSWRKYAMKSRRNTLATTGSLAALLIAFALLVVTPVGAQQQQGANVYAAVDLGVEGGTGPHGIVTFERLDNGGTRVTVSMSGLQPNSRHANDIHDGGCTGPVLFPLQTLEADANGTALAVTDLKAEAVIGGWYVNVYAGDAPAGDNIACGVVTAAMAGGGSTLPPTTPPSGGIPGMPTTGQQGQPLAWAVLVLTGAILTILLGLYLRAERARRP
jgi:hypothetical protein